MPTFRNQARDEFTRQVQSNALTFTQRDAFFAGIRYALTRASDQIIDLERICAEDGHACHAQDSAQIRIMLAELNQPEKP